MIPYINLTLCECFAITPQFDVNRFLLSSRWPWWECRCHYFSNTFGHSLSPMLRAYCTAHFQSLFLFWLFLKYTQITAILAFATITDTSHFDEFLLDLLSQVTKYANALMQIKHPWFLLMRFHTGVFGLRQSQYICMSSSSLRLLESERLPGSIPRLICTVYQRVYISGHFCLTNKIRRLQSICFQCQVSLESLSH